VIPRLLPVPGLAWDGGIYINPVPPEEAAQALRDVEPADDPLAPDGRKRSGT
jgi:hypothetical protein